MHHDYMANMMMQERQREIARSFATANAGRPKRRTMALRPWDRRRRSIRAEIAKAKVLFDSGALTQSEFDAIKAKAIP